jgi:hypothetical protein
MPTSTTIDYWALIALAIISILLAILNGMVFYYVADQMFILPMLIIDGAVIMIGVLGFASIIFALFELDDKTQALALPEGSIRAVVAIMLIVMFAILAVFLFNVISTPQLEVLDGLTAEQIKGLKETIPGAIVAELPDAGDKLKAVMRNEISRDGIDLAKQLIVILGTLVTAISSFYFGSRASSSVSKTTDTQATTPALKSLFPKTRSVEDAKSAHALSGDELANVTGITLVSGDDKITTRIESRNAHQVVFSVPDISKFKSGQKWTIEARSEGLKDPLLLAGALEITA